MRLLLEYIRGLLKEDPMGFVHDLAAASKEHGEWSWGNISKGAGRDIKRAFNKHADHQWLSTLDTVHWTDAYGLDGLTSGKDELSATMSLSGGKLEPAVWDKEVGLWVKGRITLATNDQDRLYSGKWDDYMGASPRSKEGKAQRHRQKSSGVNKLPTISKDYSRYGQLEPGNEYMEQMARENIPYVLDQSTWNPSASEPNEALVDNWRPIGIIVVDDRNGSRIEAVKYHAQDPAGATGMIKQILQAGEKFGVPLYDVDRNVLWSPGQKAVKEAAVREYIREEFLIEKAKQEASLFSGVSDFIESHHYDDVMDSAFRRIAPNMVRHVLEREINEDMSEFLDGATEGRYERKANWAAEDPSPEEFGSPKDSVDYRLGYTWGWNNADTWKSNKLPGQARKEAVEAQIEEFEDQVSEQMVIAALEAANEKVNPIKLLGKARDAIYDAVQKEGLFAGLKKGLPIAIGIIVGEALDNFIIPMAVFSLTGWVIPPLPVGVGEIINPIIISMVGAGTETEELADELGWYEGEYGTASSLGPRMVTEMKITKRQLRRIIREQLEEEENFDEQFIKLMDAGHYDQLFSMADSLEIARPDLPWTPERVQKYISHEFTEERDKRKAASLNPDGTIDFDRYTIPGVSGGEDDEFWEPIFANTDWSIDDYVKNQKKSMDARKRKQYWAKGGYKKGRYRGRQY